ncbi:hypothetical protein L914_10243 [Phytophthora nicotianae]|uniref:Uncharacterized protein n=1 Tax=Phytophthora nicotianae TaxID=4792 RepID=W2N7G8_PHYNI|nr:hypothetical protein L914_10243 [Phytophthora nicotianae]
MAQMKKLSSDIQIMFGVRAMGDVDNRLLHAKQFVLLNSIKSPQMAKFVDAWASSRSTAMCPPVKMRSHCFDPLSGETRMTPAPKLLLLAGILAVTRNSNLYSILSLWWTQVDDVQLVVVDGRETEGDSKDDPIDSNGASEMRFKKGFLCTWMKRRVGIQRAQQ